MHSACSTCHGFAMWTIFGSRDPVSFTATRQIWLLTFGYIICDNSCHIDASHPLPPKIRPIPWSFFVVLVCILHVPHAMALPCEPSLVVGTPSVSLPPDKYGYLLLVIFFAIIVAILTHLIPSHQVNKKKSLIDSSFCLQWNWT